jgi:hypothetical protein
VRRTSDSIAHLEQHLYAAAAVLQQIRIVLNPTLLKQQDCGAASKLEVPEFIALRKWLMQRVSVNDGADESGPNANKSNLSNELELKRTVKARENGTSPNS